MDKPACDRSRSCLPRAVALIMAQAWVCGGPRGRLSGRRCGGGRGSLCKRGAVDKCWTIPRQTCAPKPFKCWRPFPHPLELAGAGASPARGACESTVQRPYCGARSPIRRRHRAVTLFVYQFYKNGVSLSHRVMRHADKAQAQLTMVSRSFLWRGGDSRPTGQGEAHGVAERVWKRGRSKWRSCKGDCACGRKEGVGVWGV